MRFGPFVMMVIMMAVSSAVTVPTHAQTPKKPTKAAAKTNTPNTAVAPSATESRSPGATTTTSKDTTAKSPDAASNRTPAVEDLGADALEEEASADAAFSEESDKKPAGEKAPEATKETTDKEIPEDAPKQAKEKTGLKGPPPPLTPAPSTVQKDALNAAQMMGTVGPTSLEKVAVEEAENGQEIVETVDVDKDGIPEIRRIYFMRGKAKVLARKEVDLNGDGKYDVVRIYDNRGHLVRAITDLDYDGKADVVANYRWDKDKRQSVLVPREYGFQNDGVVDSRVYFVENQVFKRESDRNHNGSPDRFDYYAAGKLIRTELDDNDDGIIDQWGMASDGERFPYLRDENGRLKSASATPPPVAKQLPPEKSAAPVEKDVPAKVSKGTKKPAGKKMTKVKPGQKITRLPASKLKSGMKPKSKPLKRK
jgi:hypothetical protein